MSCKRWLGTGVVWLLMACGGEDLRVPADGPYLAGSGGTTGVPTSPTGGAGTTAMGGSGGAGGGGCSTFWLPGPNPPDLSACGSSYAQLSIAITSSAPRDDVDDCRLSIRDEAGNALLTNAALWRNIGIDSAGETMLKAGCMWALTPANVGTYSYVTSRVSGSLAFELNAYDDNGRLVQTATARAAVAPYPPTIPVTLAMTRVPSGSGGAAGGIAGSGGGGGAGGQGLGGVSGAGGAFLTGVDLVVMVDNSPSMAPKVTKMNAQFPKLIAALKSPATGTLPDLRVAIIDSDLGTGCAYSDGTGCGRNNPFNPNPTACFGDEGKFQMRATPTACTFNGGAQFLQYQKGAPVNYSGDINTVFACLASNLGTQGCGLEHQLQAFEWALTGIISDTAPQRDAFLRGNAYLGLVFLTDEDDCSAMMNYGMFGAKTELAAESASLRCATRGHVCGGRNLSQQNDPGLPGYPTANKYTHPFADCTARLDDPCPNQTDGKEATDTSGPTSCSPLKDIRHLAAEIKGLKADPDRQILVAGIFGWPMGDPLSNQVDSSGKNEYDRNLEAAEYKIATVPNPNTADVQHPQVYEYWPVCYDPDHQPTRPDSATGFDAAAAGWGATGGLRESAFVDEFGPDGLKFSICERDFGRAMQTIGETIRKALP